MAVELEKVLAKVKATQWGLYDIDWEAPGAELVTASEQWPELKAFMADLMWIEHVGARAFAAMATTAPTETLRQLYTYFHAEEQRHANGEMALMRRWGMIDGDAIPEPNANLRLVIEWLDRYADQTPFYVLGAVIPMLEIALDGALCRFLLETVEDPVCHEVFRRINGDEARHLAVGFAVMEQQAAGKHALGLLRMCAPMVDPRILLGIAVYVPLLSKMRDNLVELGLPERRLYEVMDKFGRIGGRTVAGRRNPWFRLIRNHARWVADRGYTLYHRPVDGLVRLTARIPPSVLPPMPTWVRELSWSPAA